MVACVLSPHSRAPEMLGATYEVEESKAGIVKGFAFPFIGLRGIARSVGIGVEFKRIVELPRRRDFKLKVFENFDAGWGAKIKDFHRGASASGLRGKVSRQCWGVTRAKP